MSAALSRRALFGSAGKLVAVAVAGLASAPSLVGFAAHEPHAALYRDLERVERFGKELGRRGSDTQAEWNAFDKVSTDILTRIEAFPSIKENAGIKAEAIIYIYADDIEQMFEDDTADNRLARQLVAAMAA